jgi:hypothetical protein
MQVHEQIYTSASQLLAPAQSDLGVVAESVGFPSKVASQLATLSSYRILQGLSLDTPRVHPSRIVAMPRNGGASYSVSRIVYAGADHSGRTTPLAHHILLSMDAVSGDGVDLGNAIPVLSNLFADDWNQSPQRFDPPRSIDVALIKSLMQSIGGADSQRLANLTGWLAARFIDGLESASSPVVFVLPTDQRDESLKLLATVHRAILPAKQASLIFQSHISSSSDLVGPAHVVATYPNSEYLNEIQSWPERRRPRVIDLSAPSPFAFNNVGFASWIEKKLAEHGSLQTIQKGLRLRESLNDIDESRYPNGFSQVWDFYESLNKGCLIANVDEIGKHAETLAVISPMAAGFVVKWANAAIKEHLKSKQSNSDWHAILQILVSQSWPEQIRRQCLEAIAEMPESSFPFALVNPAAMKIPELLEKINETITAKPNVWKTLLQKAPQQAANCRRYLENQVASGNLALPASQQAIEILIQTGSDDQQHQAVKCFLTSPIQPRPIPVTHLAWLQSFDSEGGLLQRVLDSASLPPQVADSLQDYLRRRANSRSRAKINSSPEDENVFKLAQEQEVASSEFSIRSNRIEIRRIGDPRSYIYYTALGVVLVEILGGAAFFWGKSKGIPKLSTNMSMAALAAVMISLLIAFVAYLRFSKNRIVSRQRLFMILGFFSVALMLVSAVAVLASFIVPFLSGDDL